MIFDRIEFILDHATKRTHRRRDRAGDLEHSSNAKASEDPDRGRIESVTDGESPWWSLSRSCTNVYDRSPDGRHESD
jgi:hypothetical protein